MMDEEQSSSRKWAVLIGIDCYIPGLTWHTAKATPLAGCVNDIGLVHDYLVNKQSFQKSNIERLTATWLHGTAKSGIYNKDGSLIPRLTSNTTQITVYTPIDIYHPNQLINIDFFRYCNYYNATH